MKRHTYVALYQLSNLYLSMQKRKGNNYLNNKIFLIRKFIFLFKKVRPIKIKILKSSGEVLYLYLLISFEDLLFLVVLIWFSPYHYEILKKKPGKND